MRHLPRLLAGGLVVALACSAALAGSATPASAHAELVSTEPAYGTALAEPPARVVLRYATTVEVSGARANLERDGRRVPVAKPVYASADHRNVSIPMPPDLEQGSYFLTWYLFASDGDVMGGELVFGVGQSAAAAPPSVATPATTPDQAGKAPITPGPPCAQMASEPVPGSPCYVEPGSEETGATATTAAPAVPAPPVALPAPAAGEVRSFVPLSQPQEAARWLAFASLMVLVGSVFFVVFLWPTGGRLERTRTILKVSLISALVANVAILGLKGAAVSGRDGWSLFSSEALTALDGTHPGRTLTTRIILLGLAIPVVAYMAWVPERARRSVVWSGAAIVTLGGAVFTHGQLSHGYADGSLAAAVDVVHLSAVSVWLGGLVVLAAVVLPRRRADELAELVPRYSGVAFKAVSTAAVAGTVLLILLSPAWTELPGNAYGRYLFVKLSLVVVLLATAARSRTFVRRRLTGLTAEARTGERVAVTVGAGPGPADLPPAGRSTGAPPPAEVDAISLKPFVSSVVAELVIAAGILGATALLVGRSVPT